MAAYLTWRGTTSTPHRGEEFRCASGAGRGSCEYSDIRVFLGSPGSSSMRSFVERTPTGNGGERSVVFGSISEERELTVRFDGDGPSSRRLLFEPCSKNQGRSCAIDCDHFVECSCDPFLSELFIERR